MMSLLKVFIILLAMLNLILISVFTMMKKTNLAIALAVFEAILVTSAGYFG